MRKITLLAVCFFLGACGGGSDTIEPGSAGSRCSTTADCNPGIECVSLGNNTDRGCFAHACAKTGCETNEDCDQFDGGRCVGEFDSGVGVPVCTYQEWNSDESLCDPT